MEIFLKLIEQLNSSVITLILILAVAFWAVYKLGGIVNEFSGFKEKNSTIDGSIGGIKDSLATIKATTDLLYQAHLTTVKSHSPISLTQKGIDIAKTLVIEQKVANHWDVIRNEIEKRNPSNPYDIQMISMEISRKCFEKVFSLEEQEELKLYAYKSGINLLEIFPIVGVIIRDKFLEYKGIPVDEIDVHKPKEA
jgi:hypothetical protein